MSSISLVTTAATHQMYHAMLRATAPFVSGDTLAEGDPALELAEARDRGAVSLEQVLWFVAAGVSVAVIAGVLWGKIRDEAEKDVLSPAAP